MYNTRVWPEFLQRVTGGVVHGNLRPGIGSRQIIDTLNIYCKAVTFFIQWCVAFSHVPRSATRLLREFKSSRAVDWRTSTNTARPVYLWSSARGYSWAVALRKRCQNVRSTRMARAGLLWLGAAVWRLPGCRGWRRHHAGLPWRWPSTILRRLPATATCARRADWRTDGNGPCGTRTGVWRHFRVVATAQFPPTETQPRSLAALNHIMYN